MGSSPMSSSNFGLVFCMSCKPYFKGILIAFNQVQMEIKYWFAVV